MTELIRRTSTLLLTLATALLPVLSASAQLQWDANGTGTGQTNGSGDWLGAGQWWNGSANVDWIAGADAVLGGPNTAGGTVSLTDPTTAGSITFNTFTGTYTLGSPGIVLTLNGGIIVNSTAAAVALTASPIKLGASQTWINNSANALVARSGVDNSGHTLTVGGTGQVSFDQTANVITGSGGLIKNGSGRLVLGSGGTIPIHSYSGTTTLNGGVTLVANNNIGTGNLILNGGVYESYWSTSFVRALGVGSGQVQIIGGESGFSCNGATAQNVILGNNVSNEAVWGSATFNPSALVLQAGSAQAGSSLAFQNRIDLNGITRTIRSNATAQSVTATMSGVIRNTAATPAGLIKAGPGLIVLTGANTYDGGTTINAGTLRFTTRTTMPATGNVAVNHGATLGINLGGTNEWTTGTTGNGTLGGLFDGVGGQPGSTVSFTGDVGLLLEVSGNQQVDADLTNVGSSLSLFKSGSGTLTLVGSNAYTGKTTILGGILAVTSLRNVGDGNSSLGAPATVANGGIAIGFRTTAGTLRYLGDGDSSDRVIELAGSTAGVIIEAAGEGALILTANLVPTFPTTSNGEASKTLTLGGTSPAANTLAGIIPNTTNGVATSVLSLTKAGTGRWLLTNLANTYTGATNISAGILEVARLANGGASSSIGASANGDANLLLGPSATLRYTGSGDSSNRRFRINGTAEGHGATIDASGTGALNLTNTSTPTYNTANQTRILTLRGTNTDNNTLAASIANNGTGLVNLVKEDAGTWVLTGANTYTGSTTVNGGTLAIPAGSTASTINLGASGILRLNIGVTIASTGGIQFASGSKVRVVGTPAVPSLTLMTFTGTITGTPEIETPIPEYELFIEGNALKLAKSADADSDGLPDWWEQLYTSPSSSTALNPLDDLEPDGLTNLQEFQRGTNPNKADTDDDGFSDLVETNTGTWVSLANTGTDPLNPDMDGDGLLDGVETNTGVWVSNANRGTDPYNSDTDGDGFSDSVETNTGVVISTANTGTNPNRFDTDNDGAGDWYEVVAAFTNPASAGSKPNIPYPLPAYDGSAGANNQPVKVYIMSGQSNMLGYGQVTGSGPGTLNTLVNAQRQFPNLRSGSSWVTREDVHVHSIVENNSLSKKKLHPEWKGDKYGPEFGFGSVMGWYHEAPVLLIKPSIGNRSLGWDYLPPGSPRHVFTDNYTYAAYGESPERWLTATGSPSQFGWYAGKQFDDFFIHEADMGPGLTWQNGASYISGVPLRHNGTVYVSKLAHTSGASSEPGIGDTWTSFWTPYSVKNTVDILDGFATEYPQWAAQGFVIAGFVWWQGHKDGGEQGTGSAGAHAMRYEQNLVQLITRLRAYYENRYPGKGAANAPFVVATCGFSGGAWNNGSSADTIWKAQMAVSDPTKYPAFAGNVASVDTRKYWRDASVSPTAQSYHYNWNAETYLLTGDACARAMISLLQGGTPPSAYGNWANGFSALTNSSPGFDFDQSGLDTGIEWVVGGNPTDGSDDAGLAPVFDHTTDPNGKLLFIFRRTAAAGADAGTLITVEYGSSLGNWSVAVHQGTGPNQITITEQANGFGPGVDKVTVALPGSLSPTGRLFARLKVYLSP